jgi:monovalent cation:H+ antiporter-2, CPA2 family
VESAALLLELGGVIVALAVLARLAGRLSIPTIPLYLTAGLAFGRGGLVPLVTAEEFIEIGAQVGLILLLFMLGLEYTAEELVETIRSQSRLGAFNFVVNFTPGLLAGLLLGWDAIAAVVLGGVTYVSSSGIVAKLLQDLDRIGNRETPVVLSVIVMEDLTMALFLPLLAALIAGGGTLAGLGAGAAAIVAVIGVLLIALKAGERLSAIVFSHSDEALLLTILGTTLVIAGIAAELQLSAAVAALLVGIVLSGEAAEGAHSVLTPLRDLFAAMFFVFFAFGIDPARIPPTLGIAAALAVVTGVTKFVTGWWGARRFGVGTRGRARAGATLVARGEFSIAVAGVGVAAAVQPGLGPLVASYVLLLAVLGPLVARFADPVVDFLIRRGVLAPQPGARLR